MQETSPLNHNTGPSEDLEGQVFSLFEGKGIASSAAKVLGLGVLFPCPLPSDAHAMVHHQYVLIEIKTCGSICIQFPLALVVCGF